MGDYTKGPWRQATRGPNGMPVVGDARGMMIAHVTIGHDCPHEANARLIAAAPDLLEALELVAAWGPPCCLSADEAKTFAADQEKARAAIAKARGEA